jgi:hypothetical protein
MPYDYIAEKGIIVPDTADAIAEVAQEWKDALGMQDLATTPDTPQGVLIAQEAIARQHVARNNAALANQINPSLATGVFLDALCALTGLERRKETYTLLKGVQLAGRPGTNIPAGSRARTASGQYFALTRSAVLGADGTATADFEAIGPGPVPCAAGELGFIADTLLGWETVTNPAPGILGLAEEGDEELRARRGNTLAKQGIASTEAQISGLYSLPGVRSLQFRENIASQTAVIDGITLLPHSIWACVDGGTDAEVARALFENKTVGAAYNGAVTVQVTDEWSGQAYAVKFDRPVEVPLICRVTARAPDNVPDPHNTIINAVIGYAEGSIPGEKGFTVGAAASPFELAGAIYSASPPVHVVKVELARASSGVLQTAEVPIAANEKATLAKSSVTVALQ